MHRGILETANFGDARRGEELVKQTAVTPPPYRPVRGKPVYQNRAGDNVIPVAEGDLAGPLRELVAAGLAG